MTIQRIDRINDPPEFNGCVRLLCAVFSQARKEAGSRQVHIAAPAQTWLEAMQATTWTVLEGRRYDSQRN